MLGIFRLADVLDGRLHHPSSAVYSDTNQLMSLRFLLILFRSVSMGSYINLVLCVDGCLGQCVTLRLVLY